MYSKYHSKKVKTKDGQTFDSKKEYKRYLELVKLEQEGKIKDLRRQVSYELYPKQKNARGETLRAETYKADFVYTRDGQEVVEDVKGYLTQAYKSKRKGMLYFHGITIEEV